MSVFIFVIVRCSMTAVIMQWSVTATCSILIFVCLMHFVINGTNTLLMPAHLRH